MYRGEPGAPFNDMEKKNNTPPKIMHPLMGGQLYYGLPSQHMFYDYQYQVPFQPPVHSNYSEVYSNPQFMAPTYGGNIDAEMQRYYGNHFQIPQMSCIDRQAVSEQVDVEHKNQFQNRFDIGHGQYDPTVAGSMLGNLMTLPRPFCMPPMIPQMTAESSHLAVGSNPKQPTKQQPVQIFSAPPAESPIAAKAKNSKKGRKVSANSFKASKKSRRPRWLPEEETRFVTGLTLYGKKWDKIKKLVETRTLSQIISHAQNIFKKQGLKIRDIEQADIDQYLAQFKLSP